MPNVLTGAWTQGEKDTFNTWFEATCLGYRICQFCGNQTWTLNDFAMADGAFLGLGVAVGNAKVVEAVLECDNCGHVEHINAQKIGMV